MVAIELSSNQFIKLNLAPNTQQCYPLKCAFNVDASVNENNNILILIMETKVSTLFCHHCDGPLDGHWQPRPDTIRSPSILCTRIHIEQTYVVFLVGPCGHQMVQLSTSLTTRGS